jgi:hypothetical protein
MRGRPFQKGEDDRRNLSGRGPSLPSTLRRLAREDREATFKRLAQLRDQGDDLRIALAAATVLAEYGDGKTGPAEEEDTLSEEDQREAAFDALVPLDWSWEEREALRERLGLLPEIDIRPPVLDDDVLSGP